MFGRVGQRPSFTDEFLKETLLGSRFHYILFDQLASQSHIILLNDYCLPPLTEAGPLHQWKRKPSPTHPEQPLVQGWAVVGVVVRPRVLGCGYLLGILHDDG